MGKFIVKMEQKLLKILYSQIVRLKFVVLIKSTKFDLNAIISFNL